MKTKDIDELPILRLLCGSRFPLNSHPFENGNVLSIFTAFPKGTPRKLVLSKMKAMIRKQLVEGCACGCRGDFEITFNGRNIVTMADAGLLSEKCVHRFMIRRDLIL